MHQCITSFGVCLSLPHPPLTISSPLPLYTSSLISLSLYHAPLYFPPSSSIPPVLPRAGIFTLRGFFNISDGTDSKVTCTVLPVCFPASCHVVYTGDRRVNAVRAVELFFSDVAAICAPLTKRDHTVDARRSPEYE